MMNLQTERQIDQKIVELVNWAREHYGIPERCRADQACKKIGLKLRWEDTGKQDGYLSRPQHAVVVNSRITWPPRTAFTLYHEIFHYLLEEEGDEIIEIYGEALRNQEDAFESAIERCCNAGAAEFLLPRHAVLAAIAERGFSVHLVEFLSDSYGSSLLATSVQLASCAPVPCYVVVCTYGALPAWPHPLTLYIEQAARRPDVRYPWERGTSIPPNHLLRQVWDTGQRLSGPSSIAWSSGKSMPCAHAEAKILGNRVVGILCLNHPPSKDQLSLNL